jgi:membrane protease YdiL (CAAX protease family)
MSALAIAATNLMHNEPLPAMTGILMFPAMLLGPTVAGVILTRIVDGKRGLRDLVSRMLCWRFSIRWYAVLLVPPILVVTSLLSLTTIVSTSYAPNRFLIGIFFGVPAGFLEEIGWTGFAFPKLCLQKNALAASVILGVLWSTWHLPVIDHLGTATPHGASWFSFFVTFAAAMTAIRVLISWIYTNTNSVLLAQLMHVSSTASLVIFSPPSVTARQEVIWYALYATLLWLAVAVVIKVFGNRLTRTRAKAVPGSD